MDNEKYFDINIGANILGVSPMTLRRAIKGGRMTYKIVMENYQKKYLVSYDDLNTYITYCANNNIYSMDQLKKIKDRLIMHQKGKERTECIPISDTDKDDKIIANDESNKNNDFIIELFKQQESFIENKIKQYEEKIKYTNEMLDALKIENVQTKALLDQKNMQLGLSIKKNNELNNEITFLKNNCENNLTLIKDLLNKIKIVVDKPVEKIIEVEKIVEKPIIPTPTKVIYLDIINF